MVGPEVRANTEFPGLSRARYSGRILEQESDNDVVGMDGLGRSAAGCGAFRS